MQQRAGCHADAHVDIPPVSQHAMIRSTCVQDRRGPYLLFPFIVLLPIKQTPPIVESGTRLVTTEGSSAS